MNHSEQNNNKKTGQQANNTARPERAERMDKMKYMIERSIARDYASKKLIDLLNEVDKLTVEKIYEADSYPEVTKSECIQEYATLDEAKATFSQLKSVMTLTPDREKINGDFDRYEISLTEYTLEEVEDNEDYGDIIEIASYVTILNG